MYIPVASIAAAVVIDPALITEEETRWVDVNAEYTLLREGMAVNPQNVKGTPEFDLLGFSDYLDCRWTRQIV